MFSMECQAFLWFPWSSGAFITSASTFLGSQCTQVILFSSSYQILNSISFFSFPTNIIYWIVSIDLKINSLWYFVFNLGHHIKRVYKRLQEDGRLKSLKCLSTQIAHWLVYSVSFVFFFVLVYQLAFNAFSPLLSLILPNIFIS